jgi:hypothetical protein
MTSIRAFFVLALAIVQVHAQHKLRVDDPELTAVLTNQGARVIENYGSFQIVESDQQSVPAGEPRIQGVDRFNTIQLQARDLDTRTPELRVLRKSAGAFEGSRLHLVQFAGPIKPEWQRGLEQTGAKILNYIPNNAYLVYAGAPALGRLQSWAASQTSVQWEGPYAPGYKVHPKARSSVPKPNALPAATSGDFAVQLVDDPGANAKTLQLIEQWNPGSVHSEARVINYHNLVARITPDHLDELAAQPDVISIQPWTQPRLKDERVDQIVARNINGNGLSGPGYLAWLASKGFTQSQFDASGFVVNVSDSGIDNGSVHPGHFGLYKLGSPGGGSRVAYNRLVGTKNPPSSLAGCDGHGNLNAHIIAGYDSFTGFPFADAAGYSYGLGVCPFVKVGSSVVFDPDLWTFPNLTTLETLAYNSGARISNSSWGSTNAGIYDMQSQLYDTLVRDVGGAANNRQMVVVFVAGNDASGGIESPGTAKNVITVGACDNLRPLSTGPGDPGLDGCDTPDSDAASVNNVSSFSSRGPCADGRMKPDLVAPGTHVTGGVAQNSPVATTGTGSAIACFDATGVCGSPGSSFADLFYPLGQEFYTISSGTSHSGPAVAGGCALVRQYFINQSLNPPSPAMTKAFLINSARYMTGSGANDDLWSPGQGMGCMDLGTAFDGVTRILRDQFSADTFTASGQTRTFTGTIGDPGKPFRVTLAWTDAPGSTAAAHALVNDLDLTVTVGGVTYKGNVFNGALSTAGGTADSLNNVESVFLPAGLSNSFTVTVIAANIAANALSGGRFSPQQDFALAIYNSSNTGSQQFFPSAGSYNGLFYSSGGVQTASSGAFSATTTSKGAYSAKLQLGPAHYHFSGKVDSSGAISNGMTLKDGSPLTLLLQIDPAGNRRISGTVNGASWSADLAANRTSFNARSNPAPYAGKYTIVLPGMHNPTSSNSPAGDGYAAVKVDASGTLRLAGSLADGTPWTQVAKISDNGDWPLYTLLYAGKGQVLGWQTFATPSPQSTLNGWFSWIKPAIRSTRFYQAGFVWLSTNVVGSAYDSKLIPEPGFSSGTVILTGGNFTTNLSGNVSIAPNNKVTASGGDPLSLTLNSAQGLFRGSFSPAGSRKRFTFSGALLQDRNSGSGFFLGTNQSGQVIFQSVNQ